MRRADFHESYYEHSCSITPQRDVLHIDIPGNSCFTRLFRWWNDLFLLSYVDERSRVYFTSSHAMRMERFRHFRRFRERIHPLSKFRNFWDCLILSVIVINKLIFHHNSSVIFGQLPRPFHYVAAVLELFIIGDVMVNVQTGYINKESRSIVLDKKKGLVHYCSTKLFLHVASAIPLQWMMFLKYGFDVDCSLCKSNRFTCTLKLISIFGLYRVFECSEYLSRRRISYKCSQFGKFLRICTVGFITMLQFMDLSDMVALLSAVAMGYVDKKTYFGTMLRTKFGLKTPLPNHKFFWFNLARICKSLLLFSFGLRIKSHFIDKLTAIIAYLIAHIFYMWSILECYAFICRNNFSKDQMLRIKDKSFNMAKCRQLPDSLANKLAEYYNFNLTYLKVIERQNGLFESLPEILKNEAALICYTRLFKKIPYFAEWPIDIIDEIVLMLKDEIFLKNDVVAESWVQGEGLVIVEVGELAVFNVDDEETGHLIDGDYFGELSLVTDKELRTSYVVAITPCKIVILDKLMFRKLMRQYPKLFFKMKHQLQIKYGKTSSFAEKVKNKL